LVCLALLANPVVLVLLGPQWTEVPRLVRMMALGSLCLFPAFMTYPLLVSIGRIRDTVTMSLISLPPSLVIIAAASFLGLEWVAAAQFINAPLQVYVALSFIRRHLDIRWANIGAAVQSSAVVTACAAAPPLGAVALSGFRFDVPVHMMIAVAPVAAAAWVAGLRLTNHPLYAELAVGARAIVRWLSPSGVVHLLGLRNGP